MKILHAAETIKGGVAAVLKQLAHHQILDSENNKVLCLIPKNQSDELSNIASENISTFTRNGRNIISLILFFLKFSGLVLTQKPDLVHLHSTFAGVMGRVSLFLLKPLVNPKVIYCPHAFSFIMEGSTAKKNIFLFVEKLLLPLTDHIICVSEYERKSAIELGLPGEKLTVIYNGVPEKSDYGTKLTSKPIKLLFVGRFDYQKGYDLLIHAMRKLKESDYVLTIIGDAVNDKNERINLENVIYTGWLASDQMESYFRNADVLVIPSRWEGFAMVPLEAMSYSLPIVASNSTSLPEVVKDNINGCLFESGNIDSLTNSLIKIAHCDLIKMGMEGNKFFLKNFTDKKMIYNTYCIYLSAMDMEKPLSK